MVDDTGDLLAVTLQNGNDLLGVLVEDHRVLVVTTCNSETQRHTNTLHTDWSCPNNREYEPS